MNFFLCFFLLLSFCGFAQEEGSYVPERRVHVMPSAAPEVDAAESTDEIIYDDSEADIEELEAQRNARAKSFEQINSIVPEPFDPVSELKKLGHTDIKVETLLDERVIPVFKRILEESQIKDVPADQVKAMILQKIKGHPSEKILTRFPIFIDIFVDVVRDEKALPAMLDVFTRKKDLKRFGIYWLCLLGVMVLLKWKLIPKKWPFYKRFPVSIMFSIVFTVGGFMMFYKMFEAQTAPVVRVVMSHF